MSDLIKDATDFTNAEAKVQSDPARAQTQAAADQTMIDGARSEAQRAADTYLAAFSSLLNYLQSTQTPPTVFDPSQAESYLNQMIQARQAFTQAQANQQQAETQAQADQMQAQQQAQVDQQQAQATYNQLKSDVDSTQP